jgi:lysophospholipid acyltransferase (LPLAT)-like uncharacterized protein
VPQQWHFPFRHGRLTRNGRFAILRLTKKIPIPEGLLSLMKRLLKKIIRSSRFPAFVYHSIRLYSRFIKITVENEQPWLNHMDHGGSVLLAIFHQQFFPMIKHYKNYQKFNPMLIISLSNDGNVIAPVANLSGWNVARGSSSRGGKEAMEKLVAVMAENGLGANIVDGPQGPIGKIKPGTIRIAQKTGAVIVPCVAISRSAWFFNSWDRFMLPRPFSTVTIKFCEKITVKRDLTTTEFEEKRLYLEKVMAEYLI